MSQAAHYSPSEFRFGFLPEETIGTALVPASGKTLQLINVDSISAPSLNTEIVSDVRSGAGRTAKSADLYVNSTLMKREISFSATADYNSLPELLSAVMGVADTLGQCVPSISKKYIKNILTSFTRHTV